MSKTKSRNNDDKKKKNDNTKKGKGGKNNKKKGVRQPRRVTEIVFDPEARKEYLCGFSERKKQRRAFGLAMQKVKDRKAKIEQRAERKLAFEEQIQEAEERKNQMSVAASAKLTNANDSEDDASDNDIDDTVSESQNDDNVSNNNEDEDCENDDDQGGTKVQVYEDVHTKTQWGGDVIVTTTTNFEDDDDDENDNDNDNNNKRGKHDKRKLGSNDKAQEYSGKVERFMQKIKGSMPAKKKKELGRPIKHKGKHGAANMQGIGGEGNLKAAKKLLSRTQAKVGGPGGRNKKAKR